MLDYILSRMKEISTFPTLIFIELSAAAWVFYEYYKTGGADSIFAILFYIGLFIGGFVACYFVYMGIWIFVLFITALFKVHLKGEVTIKEFQFCIIPGLLAFIIILIEILRHIL